MHSQNRFIPLSEKNEESTSDEIQVYIGMEAQITDYRVLNKRLSSKTQEPVQDLLNNEK